MHPIRIGVIGTGWTVRAQAPALQALPEFEVVAITSARRERAEAAAAKLGIPRAFTDYREMLAMPGLDAVYIGAPPYLHHEMTLAAAQAGKHLICEKPAALNAGQAREMLAAVERAGVTAMLNFEFRWRPARRYFGQLLAEGYAGRPYLINVQSALDILADPIGRTWSWMSERGKGGGMLTANGTHYIDALRTWCGEIETVDARLDTFVRERKVADSDAFRAVDAADNFSFFCRFANGAQGTVTSAGVARGARSSSASLYGSEGTLLLIDDVQIAGARAGESTTGKIGLPVELTSEGAEIPDGLRWCALLAREFARGIRLGISPSPNLTDGLRCQEVIDAIYASHDQGGGWVNVSR